MAQNWHKGIVIRIDHESATTRRFYIQVPEMEELNFKPGQFVTLDLPIHEKINKRWRSYSIASWPDGSNVFELVIVYLENGAGTTYLFNDVKVGSELIFRGPLGVFTLPDTIERNLFFICTGTGIAPFRSMVNHINRHNIPHKNIYLVFGCRLLCDGLYGDEMRALEKEMPSFHYLPTYSREAAGPGVISGYVHQVYENICNDRQLAASQDADFYLCGWKNMIDEAKQRILAMGFERKRIHQELYG